MNGKTIYKRLLSFLTSISLVISASACNKEEQNTKFETAQGTRDLKDYADFLEEQDIDYKKCRVDSTGDRVFIFEKKDSKYKIREEDTFNSILELYPMTKEELLDLNFKSDDYELIPGETLKVYYYEMHQFTLEELDESTDWHYHYIQPGETLSEIAQYYDIPLEIIQELNNIEDPNLIQSNTIIKIPKNNKEKELTK